jgi:enamine deaminase RidA (YjgF/YER057c/UK114 family)
MRKLVSSGSPYEARFGFSRAVRTGALVSVAGSAPLGPDGSTRILLTRIEDWPVVASVHGQCFGNIRPACTVMQVAGLIDRDWLVEIEADAVIDDPPGAA